MPLLFSVGQHSSLEVVGAQLRKGNDLLFSLMTSTWSRDKRGSAQCTVASEMSCRQGPASTFMGQDEILEQSWRATSRMRRSGAECSKDHHQSTCLARFRGNNATRDQGLGTLLGHPDFVPQHWRDVLKNMRGVFTRIPIVRDVQSEWFLLMHCQRKSELLVPRCEE